jgi:hypothetical protein
MTNIPTSFWAVLGTVLIAVLTALGFYGKWFLRSLDKKDACLEDERKEREMMTKGFLESLNAQNQTIANHMAHQEVEFVKLEDGIERLIQAVDFLCREIRTDREEKNGR